MGAGPPAREPPAATVPRTEVPSEMVTFACASAVPAIVTVAPARLVAVPEIVTRPVRVAGGTVIVRASVFVTPLSVALIMTFVSIGGEGSEVGIGNVAWGCLDRIGTLAGTVAAGFKLERETGVSLAGARPTVTVPVDPLLNSTDVRLTVRPVSTTGLDIMTFVVAVTIEP